MNQEPAQPGYFIVLEGIDGSGTTTQTTLLASRLASTRHRVWSTSEPTCGPVGRLIREILAGTVVVSPETIAHLFAADRCDHLSSQDGIREHLSRGEIVVCDRYKYSSLAYQTIEAAPDLVERLNAPFDDPDVVFFLDLPVTAMEERLAGRTRREIYERLEFQEKVRERYLRVLADADAYLHVVHLDAGAPQGDIAEKIWETLGETSIL